jgi:hypothetical protein
MSNIKYKTFPYFLSAANYLSIYTVKLTFYIVVVHVHA